MGLRYHKRIKICKGLYLNVSKSGVGLSLGQRGASLSVGSRGTYSNLGIPGTGISYRERIDNTSESDNSSSKTTVHYHIEIDDAGVETVIIKDTSGAIITDERIIRLVKKNDTFKASLESVRVEKQKEIAKKTECLYDIYKNADKIVSEEQVVEEMNQLKPEEYIVKEYPVKIPEMLDFYAEAEAKARREIKTIKFWTLKKLRKDYALKVMEEEFNKATLRWKKDKKEFDEKEQEYKQKRDAEYLKDFNEQKDIYEKILNGDESYIAETVDNILSEIKLPVDISVDYKVQGTCISLDLDLPEIEDYPKIKSTLLASGKVSIKNKTQLELNTDYAMSVTGLAYYLASVVFNISPKISNVKISGYTQRINKKTGNEENQYVYWVDFDRKIFATLNISSLNPILGFDNFKNQKDITSKYEMKTITLEQEK
ncbi:PF14020 family protein [Treponema socranskii subsp. socranskii VPI DR56BR1116 = ATCC 35536]|uniref:PF14020 family protein n=1 Tax=Treponema socranskii subsp. socranskii VPI DR56BR1116 = ATCC 35536 TaxID=1125725 RepID=U2LLK7_TRESO|nr:DUF4236 domain-containing protein [Treponema socranskii]ERF61744.1 PF14020 family protein [Treponema socranskii subsp. socranskii VPI DR56BR1116 = ATCC 35536]ERK05111.1 PF14020 family protein [Treponema socranskii subsp. socranskii VPI DR56BR1116 = ATCC 35536]